MNSALALKGKNVEQVTSFKYLGSMVTADATIRKEIQIRIQKASAAFSKLFQRVWSRNTICLKTSECVQNNDPPNTDSRLRDMECKTKSL